MKKFLLISVILLIAGLMITCDTGGNWDRLTLPELPVVFEGGLMPEGITIGELWGNPAFLFETPYDGSKFNAVVIEYKKNVHWAEGEVKDEDGANVRTCDWSGNAYDGDTFTTTLKYDDDPDGDPTKIGAIIVNPLNDLKKVYFAKVD